VKQVIVVLLVGVLILAIVSLLLAQLRQPTQRSLTAVALQDTAYREVTFWNPEQDLELAGMLFVPEGEGPFPAAVIIHGSGTSRRDNG
jgi:predicted peptidase